VQTQFRWWYCDYSIWKVIMASSVGTMIEWYDFYIFGSLAAVLALKFYPPETIRAYVAYCNVCGGSWCVLSVRFSSVVR